MRVTGIRLITIISVTFLAIGCAEAQADDGFVAHDKPTLEIHRAAGKITLDGNFNDPGWQGSAVARDFSEHSPGDRTKPPVATEVLVTYDDQNLYFGFLCADDPSTIRASLRDRDDMFDGDYVGILLDTYGDASWAYELFWNPLGCQGDLRMLANGNEDSQFDIVFYSKGRITDQGFQVEAAIPFSSLRFPDKPEQVWKATFWRNRARASRERFTWAAINRDDPCFMCQWGTLSGINNVKPGKNIEILPSLISYQTTGLNDPNDLHSGLRDDKSKGEASLNLRYLLSSNITVDATYNPDFSQIESDAAQIDVNTPFALYYPEKRPFFQEGSDLFQTYIDAVYTRSIKDPLAALKLTGRVDRTAIGYIGARDRHSPLVLPFDESSRLLEVGNSYSNVLRLKQTVLDDSYFGALFTDRRHDVGGGGTVVGGDGSLRFARNYRFNFALMASRTTEPNDTNLTMDLNSMTFERGRHTAAFDGESYWGRAAYLSMVRDARTWNGNVTYSETSPTFRVDDGYLERNDRRTAEIWNGLFFRPNNRLLDEVSADLDIARVWNFANLPKDEWLIPEVSLLFKRQTQVQFSYLWSRETYHDIFFPGIRRASLYVESNFSKPLSVSFNYQRGRFIARLVEPPVLGRGTNFSASGTLRLWQRLVIRPEYEYSKLDYPDGSRIYSGYVTRTRINYQFSQEWFLRVIVQYDDFERSISLEPLLSYKLNPFTIFYLGATHGFQEPDGETSWTRTGHQYFLKLQYLLRV